MRPTTIAALAGAGLAAATFAAGTGARAAPPAQGACALPAADRRVTPSGACMRCHGPPDGKMFKMPGRGFGHPVDVDYEAARAARAGRLRAAKDLPAALPLVDGKIACTTCHAPRSTTPSMLVLSADGPLCVACHVFD
jgi:predicted CXXCH cytochrome family protein